VLEFLCPNGHRIHCPEEQAGRAARCPQCGIRFRIPDPAELAPAEEQSEGAAAGQSASPDLTDAPAVPRTSDPRRGPPQERVIEFLCPNGHRLHGPASLQGRPGECPECGSRFRVPTYDDVPDDEAVERHIGTGRADRRRDSDERLPGQAPQRPAAPKSTAPERREPAAPAEAASQPPAASVHPLADLLTRLWGLKPAASCVELHLAGGQTVRVEQFAKSSLSPGYGVFIAKEADGKHTVTVVEWDAVERVAFTGIEKLPAGLAG